MTHPGKQHFLDVDYLKSLGRKPSWFGLGFIQLKLDTDTRMHFWHPDLAADLAEEELHDHRYGFTSEILVGETTHEVWKFTQDPHGDYEMVEVACQPGSSVKPKRIDRGTVALDSTYTMAKGSRYSFPPTGFHRIRATRCVTFVTRGTIENEFARVLKPLDTPEICPFERVLPENVLWDHIADLVSGDRLAKPGYHLSAIPKGILGYPEKIFEEASEFMDAINQDAHIMALVELSDLYGAMEAYLTRHHPSIRPGDLATFSKITARAFANGHR